MAKVKNINLSIAMGDRSDPILIAKKIEQLIKQLESRNIIIKQSFNVNEITVDKKDDVGGDD